MILCKLSEICESMRPRHVTLYGKPTHKPLALYDRWLVLVLAGLLLIGLLGVASSSVMFSERHYHHAFHFLIRQISFFIFGLFFSLILLRIETEQWRKWSVPLLLLCMLMLILVLVPGLGRTVNGSRRWLALGPIGGQVSELAKVSMIFYLAGYLVRQKEFVRQTVIGFVKPMMVLLIFAWLLLLEPDFGATVVMVATTMAMLFLAGVSLKYYLVLLLVFAGGLSCLALTSPYRVMRLTAFLNPWADQFNSGYQLTQSLIAFGRGGWMGVGLGGSVQKYFYLPEAHTDFLFAVLAEEFGFIGVLLILILYSILIFRGFMIGLNAFWQDRLFAAYVAYGISCWFGFQAAINMGVNTGLLPTKGLTLPFMSYGGASMVICMGMAAILIRIDYENRWQSVGGGARY